MKRQFAIIRYSGHRKGRVVEKHISTDTGIVISIFNRNIGRVDMNFIINVIPGLNPDEQVIHVADHQGAVVFEKTLRTMQK